MIVSSLPRPAHTWRPVVLPLLLLAVWDVVVTALWFAGPTHFEALDLQFTLFGSAIGLLIGFVVNAAYGRWWEARTLWGQVVNSSRSLARELVALLDRDAVPDERDLPATLVRATIAHVHLLRTSLRGQPLPEEASTYLGTDDLLRVAVATNKPNAVLSIIGERLARAHRRGALGELSLLQLEATLVTLTDAQGGLERIRNTPLPVQYRFLPRFVAIVFSVILPFAIVADLGWVTPIGSGLVSLIFLLALQVGDDLAEPFADGVYDVPMTALCRTIEIDLVEAIGRPAPAKVTPVDTVLW